MAIDSAVGDPHILDYVQAMLAIALFIVGLPSLVLELTVDDRLRDIVRRWSDMSLVWILAAAVLVAAMLDLLCDSVARVLGWSWIRVAVADQSVALCMAMLGAVAVWRQQHNVWHRVLRRLRAVVAAMGSIDRGGGEQRGAVEPMRGSIGPAECDLVDLGAASDSWPRREQVLATIRGILATRRAHDSYSWDSGQTLLAGAALIAVGTREGHLERALSLAFEMASEHMAASEAAQQAESADVAECWKALEAVTRQAGRAEIRAMVDRIYLLRKARLLFFLGVGNLEARHTGVAMLCVSRLAGLLRDWAGAGRELGDARGYVVGLLGRFATLGSWQREWALGQLHRLSGLIDSEALAEAQRGFEDREDEETANGIQRLVRRLGQQTGWPETTDRQRDTERLQEHLL